MHIRRAVAAIAVAALSATGLGLLVSPAQAVQYPQTQVVSDNPANFTPNINDGRVEAIAQAGNTMFIGGTFTQVTPVGGSAVTKNYLLAFDATTGALSTTFNPTITAEVTSLAVSPDQQSIYVGGSFNTVNGVTMRKLAKLNVSNGALVAGFANVAPDAAVQDLKISNNRLWIAGAFTKIGSVTQPALAALNPTTGARLPYMSLTFAGPRNNGSLAVTKFDITPDGNRLVAMGNFTTINGLDRGFLGLLDLSSTTSAAVADWQTNFFGPACAGVFDTYMRDVDISPDGSYFVISTTGAYGGSASPCDSSTRWEVGSTGSGLMPTWTDYTGGDTTYAVAITSAAVYTGGHFRWQNNSFAGDSAGPGAVAREGITALDPVNGLPLAWNPGRDRGVGVFDMLATSTGLWVASDTTMIGGETHARIAFFPLTGGTTLPPNKTGVLPGHVFLAGGTPANSPILYRVNTGGGAVLATDNGPDWAADNTDPSPYRNNGSNTAGWDNNYTLNPSVPSTTPGAIFTSERWSPSDNPAMSWAFPVSAGVPLQVRLYFANRCSCTSTAGARVFNVAIDGTTVLDHYDIVADTGDQTGTMKQFNITSDGTVNIDFSHITENPLINGIEIVRTDDTGPAPSVDDLQHNYLTTTGGTVIGSQSGGGVQWSSARGATMIDGSVYYGATDGSFTSRTFDGTTFGPAVAVNTQDQISPLTDWQNEIKQMTGLFYNGGRLYFTLAGDPNLYYRYFTPSSRVVGAQRFAASASVSGIDFSAVDGMFVTDGKLYFGQSSDSSLRSINWNGSAPVAGTATVVSSPATDGVNWHNRALWLYTGTNLRPPGPANVPPTAALSVTCTNLACTADGSGSADSDGTIASYAYDFGDGATGSGVTANHTYAAAGTYTVKLTVTDNSGATGTATRSVTVTAPPPATSPISFAGTASNNVNASSVSVTVPSGVTSGDGLLLFVTNSSTATPATPSGWTLKGSRDMGSGNGMTYLYSRSATSTSAGSPVSVTLSAVSKVEATVVAYHGTTTDPVASFASAAETASTTSHTAPSVPVTADGSWVLNYWADKSSTTNTWTVPTGVTQRGITIGSGSGRVTAVVGDSGAGVSPGATPSRTAVADAASSKATMWSVVLGPAGAPANVAPTAALTVNCSALSCTASGSGSSDPDGTIASYAWTFGDGGTGSGVTTSHTYAAAGTYTVTLTVTDNGGKTGTASKSVTVTAAAAAPINFVGSNSANVNATNATLTVPAAAATGDALLLFVTNNSSATTVTTPTGWTLVSTRDMGSGNGLTYLYSRVAPTSAGGSTVLVQQSATAKMAATVLAYHGTGSDPVATAVSAAETTSRTTHTTPGAPVAAQGSWVVSYWADKSATTSVWTPPNGETSRATTYGTGSGRVGALAPDGGAAAPAGTSPSLTATSDSASSKATMWTVVLRPAG